jgi:hypothetical protein
LAVRGNSQLSRLEYSKSLVNVDLKGLGRNEPEAVDGSDEAHKPQANDRELGHDLCSNWIAASNTTSTVRSIEALSTGSACGVHQLPPC